MELTCDALASAQLPSLLTRYAEARTGHSREVQQVAQQLRFKWQKLMFSKDDDEAADGDAYMRHKLELAKFGKNGSSPGPFGSLQLPPKGAFNFVQKPEYKIPLTCRKRNRGLLGIRLKCEAVREKTRIQTK